MDLNVTQQHFCQAPACYNVSSMIRNSISPRHRVLSPCADWSNFVCETFDEQNEIPEGRIVISLETKLQDDLNRWLSGILHSSYAEVSKSFNQTRIKSQGPQELDQSHLHTIQQYYHGCVHNVQSNETGHAQLLRVLDLVRKPFVRLDDGLRPQQRDGSFFEPEIDSSTRLTSVDYPMVRDAIISLSQWGIFPFAKLSVQNSLLYANETIAVVEPNWVTAANSKWSYKIDSLFRDKYTRLLRKFLLLNHGNNSLSIRDLKSVPKNVLHLEKKILKLLPRDRKKWLIKGNVERMKLWQLNKLIPMLELGNVVKALSGHGKNSSQLVEVVFPDYFHQLHLLLDRQSKETIRTWFLWQTFLQTKDLWDMDWAADWKNFTTRNYGNPPRRTKEEMCLARVQKHFGLIVDSFYVRQKYSPEGAPFADALASNIRDQWIVAVRTTYWIQKKTKAYLTQKLDKLRIAVGHGTKPDILDSKALDDYYAGANVMVGRPEFCDDIGEKCEESVQAQVSSGPPTALGVTHIDDYLHLEKWHQKKIWRRLGEAIEDGSQWPINSLSLQLRYDPTQNQLLIPAALLQTPFFHHQLPGFVNYGALGTMLGRELAKVINAYGQQYQSNGALSGRGWTWADREFYDKLGKCYERRWNRKLELEGQNRNMLIKRYIDEVHGEQHGLEMAYKAWVATQSEVTDQKLPDLQTHLRSDQLFWILRTLPLCGRTSLTLEDGVELYYGTRPPFYARRALAVQDLRYFHESFECSCQNCLAPVCKIFGERPGQEKKDEEEKRKKEAKAIKKGDALWEWQLREGIMNEEEPHIPEIGSKRWDRDRPTRLPYTTLHSHRTGLPLE